MQSALHFKTALDPVSDEARFRARQLADWAARALIAEAELTPKPALVDKRGSGAHSDLSLALMRRSAHRLQGQFELMALVSFRRVPTQSLREELGALGRSAERSMLSITDGVNTHRGAIWALGLLVAAAAMGSNAPGAIANRAGRLARIPDRNAPTQQTYGRRVIRRYSISGARGEAQAGFPHVIDVALPMLYCSRRRGASETDARINALLAIMISLEDTCLLHRGGWTALDAAQRGAAAVLAAGGASTVRGSESLQRLDRDLTALTLPQEGVPTFWPPLSFSIFLPIVRLLKNSHGNASF